MFGGVALKGGLKGGVGFFSVGYFKIVAYSGGFLQIPTLAQNEQILLSNI